MVEGEGLVLNFHLLKKIQKEEKKKKKETYIYNLSHLVFQCEQNIRPVGISIKLFPGGHRFELVLLSYMPFLY